MTTIKTKWIEFINWRGRTRRIEFDPKVTDLVGTNGTGKSTVAHGFNWNLTGKDLFDRPDYGIKDYVQNELNQSDHIVELCLDKDGVEQRLKRVYREKWTKKKGATEETYDGNTTLYFINDVPFQAKQYAETINSWVPDSILKLITNPLFFNTIIKGKWEWTDQRAIIETMVGEISIETTLNGAKLTPERRSQLIDILDQGKTFESYKREINAKKKIAKDEVSSIPKAIERLKATKQEAHDWEFLRNSISENESKQKLIEDQIADKSKVGDEKQKTLDEKRRQVRVLTQESADIEDSIKRQFKTENDLIREEIQSKTNRVNSIQKEIDSVKSAQTRRAIKIESLTHEYNELVKKYNEEKAKTMPELDPDSLKCPECGTEFKPEKAAELKEHYANNWNTKHSEQKAKFRSDAVDKKSEYDEMSRVESETENVISSLEKEKEVLESEIKELSEKPLKGATHLMERLNENEQYSENIGKIYEINQEIKNLESKKDDEKEELSAKLLEIKQLIEGDKDLLRIEKDNERIDTEVKKLSAEQLTLNQTIADLEAIEMSIDKFNHAKYSEIQERVNKIFYAPGKKEQLVFKMFRTQENGEIVPDCVLTYGGKPWAVLSTGEMTYVGLLCLSVFQRHYGINMTVFVENREGSVLKPDIDFQVVNLWVDENVKTLTIGRKPAKSEAF